MTSLTLCFLSLPLSSQKSRTQTFFSDEDYAEYRELTAASCAHCGTKARAYCLMPNQVRLVVVPNT